jgi:glycosyltransferase involved in cell wall biosynthesis
MPQVTPVAQSLSPLRSHTPRVSVVMSAYNASPYVRQATESILNQSFTDFEFLVIDDGSTDDTLSVLRELASRDDRVTLLTHEHRGIPRESNCGIALARGEFVARQDADDISNPHRLAREVEFLDHNPDVAVVGSVAEVIDATGSHLRTLEVPLTHEEIRSRLPLEICFLHGSLLMRKVALQEVEGYREQFPVSSDFDLYVRLSERFKVANLPQALYHYRARPDRVSLRHRNLQQLYHDIAVDMAEQRRLEGRDLLGATAS